MVKNNNSKEKKNENKKKSIDNKIDLLSTDKKITKNKKKSEKNSKKIELKKNINSKEKIMEFSTLSKQLKLLLLLIMIVIFGILYIFRDKIDYFKKNEKKTHPKNVALVNSEKKSENKKIINKNPTKEDKDELNNLLKSKIK